MSVSKLFLAISFMTILLTGCGGGSGDESKKDTTIEDTNKTSDISDVDDSTPDIVESAYAPGLTLKENDFWKYTWQRTETNAAQGSSTTVSNKSGKFSVILGTPTLKNGVNAFPVTIDGDSDTYAPRWKYLATSDNGALLGSTGGEFKVIYSATQTTWEGGGFFISFNDSDEVKVQSSKYEGIYNTLDAIRVSHADSSGGCEYILGYSLCSDSSTSASVKEYYKKGLGTVGFYKYSYSSYSGGGFSSSNKSEAFVELIDSSMSATDGSELKKPSWKELATLPSSVIYHSAAVLNDKIYIVGDKDSAIQVYNIATNGFDKNITLLSSANRYKLHTLDGYLYIMSQENGVVKLVDPENNTMYYRSSFPSYGATTNWNYFSSDTNKTYNYTLGMASSHGLSGKLGVGLFDPSSSEWSTYADAVSNYNRWGGFKIVEVDNILYLIGGSYLSSSVWNTWSTYENIRRFDLLTNTWLSNIAKMDTPREDGFSIVKFNGKIIVLGGHDRNSKTLSTVEEYDPKTNKWAYLEPMPRPLANSATVTVGNKIYLVSGTTIYSFEP